jgi:ArsR family transcriptional regulator, nickel/cobalt-responsive transcriptional repressor
MIACPKPTPAAAAMSAGVVALTLKLLLAQLPYEHSFNEETLILAMPRSSAGHTHGGPVTPEVAERVADAMHALATPSRVLILAQLRERPRSVSELVEAVGMEQSAVSHQLRLLRDSGLVVGERQGRNVVYSLYDHHVAWLIDQAVGHATHVELGPAAHPVREVS